ncbi:g10261 [Coccomyxa elongata]
MEATPYAVPVRHKWWANSTPEAEKENKPHHISLLDLQRPLPGRINQPQNCASSPKNTEVTNVSGVREDDQCASTGHKMQQKCKIESLHLTCITPIPALENSLALPSSSESELSGPLTPTGKRKDSHSSPASQRSMFATVYGNSPGNTPMPRSSSAVLCDLPIAPKKPVSPFNGKIDFNSGMPPCLQSCPGRAQDRAKRIAAGHAHHRVRVRRALNLQSSGSGNLVQSRENRSFAIAFERLRTPGPAGGQPRGTANEQLFSLDEASGWSKGAGSQTGYKGRRGLPPLSRKRSEPLSAPADRNMRQRCATWNATAAAAHTLARLQLADDS